jgi:hypothetical protein
MGCSCSTLTRPAEEAAKVAEARKSWAVSCVRATLRAGQHGRAPEAVVTVGAATAAEEAGMAAVKETAEAETRW